MITIQDILTPAHVRLQLSATTQQGAIHEVADLLKGEEKVLDWTDFYENLKNGNSCFSNADGYGICIPHSRTHCVTSMVIAAGRSRQGILFEDASMRVHYIFVIGVPVALAADYLRIIGALARIVKSPEREAELRAATTKLEFLGLLSAGEID